MMCSLFIHFTVEINLCTKCIVAHSLIYKRSLCVLYKLDRTLYNASLIVRVYEVSTLFMQLFRVPFFHSYQFFLSTLGLNFFFFIFFIFCFDAHEYRYGKLTDKEKYLHSLEAYKISLDLIKSSNLNSASISTYTHPDTLEHGKNERDKNEFMYNYIIWNHLILCCCASAVTKTKKKRKNEWKVRKNNERRKYI